MKQIEFNKSAVFMAVTVRGETKIIAMDGDETLIVMPDSVAQSLHKTLGNILDTDGQ